MDINYIAIIAATVVQFIIGAIWYTPIFGRVWGKMHGFDAHSPEMQAEMRSKMAPLLIAQFVVTFATSFIFVLLMGTVSSDWNPYGLAGHLWLGFVVPTQVSAVLFGGTPPQWIVKKIAIMAFGSLACLQALALVVDLMG